MYHKHFVRAIFKDHSPEIIINLAAQAGVRYSLQNPSSYIDSNIVGFSNLLECCRKFNVENLIYASSSSVYGENKNFPLKEEFATNPVSFYAATKICNEILAKSYSQMASTKFIGLRFFTVYGEWGRPDMLIYKYLQSIYLQTCRVNTKVFRLRIRYTNTIKIERY